MADQSTGKNVFKNELYKTYVMHYQIKREVTLAFVVESNL